MSLLINWYGGTVAWRGEGATLDVVSQESESDEISQPYIGKHMSQFAQNRPWDDLSVRFELENLNWSPDCLSYIHTLVCTVMRVSQVICCWKLDV